VFGEVFLFPNFFSPAFVAGQKAREGKNKRMNKDGVSRIANLLASFVSEETVASARARYGSLGDELLAFAVALEIGLPALTTLQVAQLSNKNRELEELRGVIREQEARFRERSSFTLSEVHESTRVDDSSLLEVDVNLANETSAILNVSSDDD
jgi:hypothetical protein